MENEDFKLEEIFILSLVRDVATVMCCYLLDSTESLSSIRKNYDRVVKVRSRERVVYRFRNQYTFLLSVIKPKTRDHKKGHIPRSQ